jgi:cell division protein FtsL
MESLMEDPIVVRRPLGPPPFALRLAAVVSVPLLLCALVATGQKAVENYRLNQDAEALRAEIVNLRVQNIQLQQEIEQARTDAAIETIAREQLGLIRPGDHPFVVTSGSDTVATPPRAPVGPETAVPQPVWRQWWDYFFG